VKRLFLDLYNNLVNVWHSVVEIISVSVQRLKHGWNGEGVDRPEKAW